MVSWQVETDLTGFGDIVFDEPWNPFKIGTDVTATGHANQMEWDDTGRWGRIGWWTFIDSVNGSEWKYLYHPPFWIEFIHAMWFGANGETWYPNGVYGLHYHLYPDVVADFTIAYP